MDGVGRKRERSRWLAVLAGVLMIGTSATVEAEIGVEVIRDWPMPVGISPYTARIDGSLDGEMILVTGRGVEGAQECVVVVSGKERSRAYSYRHQFHPTRCLDGVGDGKGGFFVRGERSDREPEEETGFTVRISAEGEVLWSLEDQEFSESFEGEYVGALAGMAYDQSRGRLIAMSRGERRLAGASQVVMQVHQIDGESGALLGAGQRFGTQSTDVILDLVAREGEFLVLTLDGRDQEVRFYRVGAEERALRTEPGDRRWAERWILGPIGYERGRGSFVLSEPIGGGRPEVMALDLEDQLVWVREYRQGEEELVEGDPLGEAERLWVGRDLLALGYRNSQREYFLRFLDPETGEELGIYRRRGLLEADILGLSRNDLGGLRLVALDLEAVRFVEADLFRGSGEQREVEEEEEHEESGESGGGCGVVGSQGKERTKLFWLMMGSLVIGLRRGRRSSRVVIAKGGEQH